METSTVLLLLGIAAVLLWASAFGGRLPRPYRHRPCQGRRWRNTFRATGKHEIRQFLVLVVDAFAFRRTEALKLAPTDRILDIYRSLYPSLLMGDALELETLALDLERHYGLRLAALWSEHLTLGEVFAMSQARTGVR